MLFQVESQLELAKAHLLEKQRELEDYKGETLKVIRGQSKLSIDLLNSLVAETQLLSWADLYEKSTFEAKKMIVAQFIKSVRVGKDYDIEVDFNVSFEEFQSYCHTSSDEENECNRVERYALSQAA